jgi:hypothetical protein
MKKQNPLIDIVRVFDMPIISHRYPTVPPDELRHIIVEYRMLELLKNKKLTESATDPEVLWYISSASLESPISREWVNIMMCLMKECMPNKDISALNPPDSISEYERTQFLDPLKHWIRKKQLAHIKEQEKKNETSLRVVYQTELFDKIAI